MSNIIVELRQVRSCEWAVFGPLGNQLSPIFRGTDYKAFEWARKWASSWHNWTVTYNKEKDNFL